MTDVSIRTASIVLRGAPVTFTMNKLMRMHHQAVARNTAGIRSYAASKWEKALDGRTLITPIKMVVGMTFVKGRVPQDLGACHPAAKAAIDGLVDAGGIPDDDPEHVWELTFIAHSWKPEMPTEMAVTAITLEGEER